MSSSVNQNLWYPNGEVPLPPSVAQFATSPSPPPWRAGGPFYSLSNAANNLSSVGAPPPGPPVRLLSIRRYSILIMFWTAAANQRS